MENIDKVKDLIRRTWIVEIPDEGEVWFRNRGLDCRVVFSKAKVGWSRKPITTDRYVMVDAEMGEMFKFIKTFFSMEEDEVSVIRRFLMEWATEEHMKYLSEKSNQEDNDSDGNDPTEDMGDHIKDPHKDITKSFYANADGSDDNEPKNEK